MTPAEAAASYAIFKRWMDEKQFQSSLLYVRIGDIHVPFRCTNCGAPATPDERYWPFVRCRYCLGGRFLTTSC
jgi:DNA-directed RNA polymerase subunit RPC12/RpoP